MRIVKERMKEMLPDAQVFLDVDDLKSGRGREYVLVSDVLLVFLSKGYLQSPNCCRELLTAIAERKRIVTVVETEVGKGALTMDEVRAQLVSSTNAFAQWGLIKEMDEWGFTPPSAEGLHEALFTEPTIEWTRIGSFQDVS